MDVSNVHEILENIETIVRIKGYSNDQIYRSEAQRDNATRIAESLQIEMILIDHIEMIMIMMELFIFE